MASELHMRKCKSIDKCQKILPIMKIRILIPLVSSAKVSTAAKNTRMRFVLNGMRRIER